MKKTVIVIPARYGSTRFPGKPLAKIAEVSLLQRVWSLAKAVDHIDDVYIATDDQRIAHHAEEFGGNVIQTSENCLNGTERVYEAVQQLSTSPDVIINFQGDAVLTPPWVLQALVDSMQGTDAPEFSTPACQLTWEQVDDFIAKRQDGIAAGTFVTFDKNYHALYFSKSLIPFLRSRDASMPPVYKHIGIYAYTKDMLEKYLTLSPTQFELAESLEQLRALENGFPIKIVKVDYKGRTACSIDNLSDVKTAEDIIKKEGELL